MPALSVAVSAPVPNLPVESELSDEQLVGRVVAGDRRLYAVLIRRNNQRLFRIVRAIVRNDEDAEDVVQTTYVRAFDKLSQFRADAKFATWLTKIAVNEALHSLEARKRHAHLTLDDTSAEQPTPRIDRNPEEVAHRRQMQKLLEHWIDGLPDTLRVVLVMRDVQELSTLDTAQSLGISEEAVRVRLHRARNLLEERISSLRSSVPEAFHFAGERCQRMLNNVADRLNLNDGM